MNVPTTCKSCFQQDVHQDDSAGYYVCRNCGLVSERFIISHEKEWRQFKDDDSAAQRDRINVISMSELNNPTKYGCSSFNPKLDMVLNYNKDQKLKALQKEVTRICSLLSLNESIQKKALEIAGDFTKPTEKRIGSKDLISCASIYISARLNGLQSLTSKDFKKLMAIDETKLKKMENRIRKELKIISLSSGSAHPSPVHSQSLGYESMLKDLVMLKLGLPANYYSEGLRIASVLHKKGVWEGKRPKTIVAICAAIVLGSDKNVTLRFSKLVSESSMGRTTIEAFVKKLKGILETEVPHFGKEKFRNLVDWMQ